MTVHACSPKDTQSQAAKPMRTGPMRWTSAASVPSG
jgi:hypothetical protein